ncbi:ABC transporter ATP-binding protein [Jannaschia aquimarina]|uniref:LptB_2 protein n=1 Tax=Jannaschia aquimarina TaxID=935700 RepID=A0A0D1CPW4_9RHOB|nr:ABC transporter ATP-binding protein [Jannaschia aquimarina]KIT16787.1 Lipopolysaccharide export system ATP-binding protein LptB [Jannaschia aquimarina]SNS52375.1 amino acid/amide ABC transporter ATP-binding protein 1, HAAT family [Jannaschia aquimarina]
MADPVLSVTGLTKRFGAIEACSDVSLDLHAGEIHALIGPNGAGKSTLIAQIAGGLRPDAGSIRFLGRDVTALDTVARARLGLGRSFQVSAVVPDYSVVENVMLALHGRDRTAFRPFGHAFGKRALTEEARAHAARTHLSDRLNVPARSLAHGERRRLELAMALALRPRAFLLDEPMAGLGQEGAAELTALLSDLRDEAPILLVEHDMDAVFALADRISVLVYGRILATGTPDEIRADPQVRAAYLGDEVPA